eukprot:861075-Pyramimonas_sp.AAC.1
MDRKEPAISGQPVLPLREPHAQEVPRTVMPGTSSNSGPNASASEAGQVQVPEDDDPAELETIPHDEDGDRLDE